MTKMKSKKMTKSTFAIIVMAIALVALLAFGGTYAYFTASTTIKDKNTFKTGIISVKNNTLTNITTKNVVSGEKVADNIVFANDSNRAAYIFVKISATYTKGSATDAALPAGVLNLTPKSPWAETSSSSGIYYIKTTDADPQTGSITVCDAINFNADVHYVDGSYNAAGSTTGVDLMDATIKISIETHAVQAIKSGTTEFDLEKALAEVAFA